MPWSYARGKRYWRQFHQTPFEFNDQFQTPHGAVLPSPQLAEPGPGSWLVSDVDSRMSIPAGGGLLWTGIGGAAWDRCMLAATTPFVRKSGRYCQFELTPTTAAAYLRGGWNFNLGTSAGTGATGQILANEATIYVGGGGFINVTDGLDVVSPLYPYSLGTSYTFRVYDAGFGWLYYVCPTASLPHGWVLLWERAVSYPKVPHFTPHLNNHSVQGTCAQFFVREGKIKPPVAAQSLPGAGELLSAAADGIAECELQAPAAGVINLVFRYSDAANFWYAQVNTLTDSFWLKKVVAGVDTFVAQTSVLWQPGAWSRIRAVCFANHIRLFSGIQSGPSTDDTFNQTALLFGTDATGGAGKTQNLQFQTGGRLLLN